MRCARQALAILTVLTVRPLTAALPPDLTQAIQSAPGPDELPGADAVYLRHEREAECDTDGRLQVILRQTVKILRPGGRRFERVELPWIGNHQKLEVRAARTVLANGREVDVKDLALEQVPHGYYGERYGAVDRYRLNLPYVEPGATIDWEVSITDLRPSLPDGLADRFQMQLADPVARAVYRVRVPAGTLLRQAVHGTLDPPTVRRVGGFDETSWQAMDVPALPRDLERPSDDRVALSILVSAVDSWQRVADRYRELALPMYAPDAALREVAKQAAGSPDPVLALFRRVATRIGYGFGGFERGVAGIQPLPAYQTWRRQQGDCKDQATLLITLLEEAGQTAWPALLRRKVRGPLVDELPAMVQFDHVVVAVPDSPGYRFLDPTFSFGPADYLPADLHGVKAMLVKPNDLAWATLPSMPAEANTFERAAELSIDESGALAGTVTIQATGGFEQSLRGRFAGANQDAAEQEVAAGLNAALGSVRYTPGSLTWTDSDALDEPFAMHYGFAAAAYALQTRKLLLVRPAVFQQAAMPVGLAVAERTQPLSLAVAPEKTVNRIRFAIPPSLSLLEIPEDQAAAAAFGSFAIRFRRQGDAVLYTREVTVERAEIPVTMLPEARQWYRALLAGDRELLVLQRRDDG